MKRFALSLFISSILLGTLSHAAEEKNDKKRTVAASDNKVEISGQSARKLYFALEESGAQMGSHSRRITEYTLGNVYCYSETNVSTKEADFSCTITLAR